MKKILTRALVMLLVFVLTFTAQGMSAIADNVIQMQGETSIALQQAEGQSAEESAAPSASGSAAPTASESAAPTASESAAPTASESTAPSAGESAEPSESTNAEPSESIAPATYTVAFLDSTGAVIDTQKVAEGGAATAPQAPALEGYTFSGWDTDFSVVTGDITVTALYTKNAAKTMSAMAISPLALKCTLTYYGNENTGGTAPSSVSINWGSSATVAGPGTLVKTGYKFVGWRNWLGTAHYSPGDSVKLLTDLNLYAEWESAYTVTYNGNGNTAGAVPTDANTYLDSETVTAAQPGTLARTYYQFNGWNTMADGSGTTYAAGATFNVSRNTILYAQWKKVQFFVTYNGNTNTGGAAPTDATVYNTSAPVTVANNGTLTKTDFRFMGWNTKADGTGSAYAAASTFAITADTTLFAQWKQEFNITYSGNTNDSGTPPVNTNNYISGDSIPLPDKGTLAKTDYRFVGWNTQANGSGTSYAAGATYTVSGDQTLFAQWKQEYNVSYNGNGSDAGSPPVDLNNYISGNVVTVSGQGTLSRTGYTFAGWKINNTGTTYTAGQTFAIAGDTMLYAQWNVIVFKIQYNGNSQNLGMPPETDNYNYGTTATIEGNRTDLYKMFKTYYSFTGWNTAADGSGTHYSPGQTFSIYSDLYLYAEWQGDNVTVHFNANGGTVSPSSQVKEYGSFYGKNTSGGSDPLPTPTRAHYKFTGWKNSIGDIITDSSRMDRISDHTLTATWDYIGFTIAIMPDYTDGHSHIAFGQVQLTYGTQTATLDINGSYTFDYVDGQNSVDCTATSPLGVKFRHWDKLFGSDITSPTRALGITAGGTYVLNPEWETTAVYTISTSAVNGAITPINPQMNSGSSQMFTYSANPGYILKDVKVNGVSVGTPASYTFTNVTASQTISVEFALPPVTGIVVTGFSRGYDGNVHNVSVGGTLTGDTVSYSLDGVYYSTSPINFKDVTPAGGTTVYVKVERAGCQPYLGSSTAVITKKLLTATAENKQVAYGSTAPVYTAAYNGFIEGESEANLIIKPNLICGYSAGSPAGLYAITASGAAAVNYELQYLPGTLTVNNSTLLTIKAKDKGVTYGEGKPAFEVEYSGFTAGDDAADLGGVLAFDCAYTAGNDAGTYTITPKGLTSGNYTIQFVSGDLTVGQAALTITADDKTITYGDAAPVYTAQYSGFVSGDGPGSLGGVLAFDCGYDRDSRNAGSYAITPGGLTSDNYSIDFKQGTLNVDKAVLRVTANDAAAVYGEAAPAFTVRYSAFENGDSPGSLGGTLAFDCDYAAGSDADIYPIMPEGLASVNYEITYNPGTLTVNKADLTVIADDQTAEYGSPAPAFTSTFDGLVAGDTADELGTVRYLCGYAAGSDAGNYTIMPGGLSSQNYSIGYVSGQLMVSPVKLMISANAGWITYGEMPVYSLSFDGFVLGQNESVLSGSPTFDCSYDTSPGAGNFDIFPGGFSSGNYDIEYVPGMLFVDPKTLRVTSDDKWITYGDGTPAFTAAYDGFVLGDTEADVGTLLFDCVYLQGSNAGVYDIAPYGLTSNNYTFDYEWGRLFVQAKELLVRADDQWVTYGDAAPAYTASYDGLVLGDTPESLGFAPTFTCGYAPGSTAANTYPIMPDGLSSDNYAISYQNGLLTVDKKNLTVKSDDKNVTYGDAAPAYTASYDGLVLGETAESLGFASAFTCGYAPGSTAANTYTIMPGGLSSDDYAFAYQSGLLTVNKKALTVTADGQSVTYGDPAGPFSVKYGGFVLGQNESVLTGTLGYTCSYTAGSGVGNYSILPGGLDSADYAITFIPGELAVGRKTLRISAENKTVTYGGDSPAYTVTYDGFITGDDVSKLSGTLETYCTYAPGSPVGTYGIVPGGLTSGNYSIHFISGALTVDRAPLVVRAENKTISYGNDAPTYTAVYEGLVLGQDAGDLGGSLAFDCSYTPGVAAGTYGIAPSGLTSENYEITFKNGILTVTNETILTVTAKNTGVTYGDAKPSFEAEYSGFVAGDDAGDLSGTLGFDCSYIQGSGAGDYSVTPKGLASGNYTIQFVAGNLHVDKKELTVTADNQSVTYGDAAPAYTASYSGFIAGEDETSLAFAPAFACGYTAGDTAAATYTIMPSGLASDDYSFTYKSGTLSVGKKLLTVTANNQSVTYGDAATAYTASYSGFIAGEDETTLAFAPAFVCSYTAGDTAAATYAIMPGGLTSNDYTFDYKQGTLTVGKKELTVTADNQSVTYGDAAPAYTASYSGFIAGEDENTLAFAPAFACSYTAGDTAAATYTIMPSGLASDDYGFTYKSGTLSVGKKLLTVTADDQSVTYGDAAPAYTASYSGFITGEDETTLAFAPAYSCSYTAGNTAAAIYTITPGGLTSNDYSFDYKQGTLTVGKKTLTVTADDQSVTYGDDAPTYTASYSGFIAGEDENSLAFAPAFACSYTAGHTAAATYAITPSGLTSDDYTFDYKQGTLTVGKKELTVTADNQSVTYGDAAPAYTASYSGFIAGEDETTLAFAPAFACSYTAGDTAAATYTIMPSGLASDDYSFTYKSGTLSVGKKLLTVTADNQSVTYGDVAPAYTASYSGFIAGEDETTLAFAPAFACSYTAGDTAAATYTIMPSGLASDDYTFDYKQGTLTVGKKTLTVTADDQSVTYGDDAPTYTASYSGFIAGEDENSLAFAPAYSCSYTAGDTAAATYAITPGGLASDDYTFDYKQGTLTVGKKTLMVTADDQSVTYGDAAPAYTVVYDGFYDTDTQALLTTQPTATSLYAQGSGVGSYAIIPSGGDDENYSFDYVNGTLDVGKKVLKVTADNKAVTYGGAAPAYTVVYDGFYDKDTQALLTTQPTATSLYAQGSGVGSYAIIPSGGDDENYSFDYVNGTLDVGKKVLKVTADNKAVTYGDAAPAYTVAYDGFYDTDSEASLTTGPTNTCAYAAGSAVGTYEIMPSGADAANYTFAYLPGTLTVGQAALSVKADDKAIIYGDAAPVYTVQYNGLVAGDDETDLNGKLTTDCSYAVGSPAGNYTITPGGLTSGNYLISFETGALSAATAPLTVTAADQTVIYLDAPAAYTASITGFVAGDDAADLGGALALTCSYAAGNPTGTYAIVPSGLTSGNYTITNVNGTLTVVLGTYQVQFIDVDGTVLSTQTVTYGSGATAPATPAKSGYRFVQWDKPFSNITGNLTVSPVYVDVSGAVLQAAAAPLAPAAAAPATIPAETVPQAAPSASVSTAPSTVPSAGTSEQPTETIQNDTLPQAGAAGDDAAGSGHGMPMWAWLMIIAGAALFFILFAVWKKKKKKENEA